ncbi:MAG TPA: hypothetical protein VMF70_04840 [Gemmatimonadales bacterium]|nr:hypothetical protein [Gemmatimonadales bacterium]
MSDTPPPPAGGAAPPPPAAPPPRKRWWHHWRGILVTIVLTPVLLFVAYTFVAVNWSYSDGERAGTLQKFSRKGWLCKTWEGELMQPTAPGVAPTLWYFTVRDDETARRVEAGLGVRIVLHYKEHRGVPFACFGDTHYWVDRVRVER